MLKRISFAIALVCLIPTLAQAWSLTTQAKSSGGTLSSRNMVNQTSSSGSLFKSYTTHAPLAVTVAANTGYGINNVTVNGVVINLPASPYTATVQGMNAQSVTASFAPTLLSVTAGAGEGGTASPASVANIYYGTKLGSALAFSFKPAAGYRLASLSGATGATLSSSLPAATNATVTVSFPAGYTFSGPVALSGTFGSPYPVAIAGAAQTVLVGSAVTLTGSYSGGSGTPPAYAWSQTAGPAAVALVASGSQALFTASVPGNYQFKLTLDTGSSASTGVTVCVSAAEAARKLCQNCHSGASIGPAGLFAGWSSSRHKAQLVMCVTCHVSADSGGHPGSLTGGAVNETTFSYTATGANFCTTCHNPAIVAAYNGSAHPSHAVTCASCHPGGVHNPDFNPNACDGCHRDGSGNVARHPVAIGSTGCVACHDPHAGSGSAANMSAKHFNNVTGAGYPASYVTSRAACSNCHYYEPGNLTVRQQWGASGHAATDEPPWSALDFKARSGCVQCHTTSGFIAYSTGRVTAFWGTAGDKTKEVLTCIGCHSDITTGALRKVVPVRPFADDSYQNRELSSSNLCMNCHSGTNNGKSIQAKVGSVNFAQTAFISPHYLAAGGTLHGQAGYHFPGQSYAFYSSNTHRGIGLSGNATGSGGPCVGCHMSAQTKHLYQAATADANGVLTGISSTVCVNCHSSYLDLPGLSADKSALLNALEVLRGMLASRNLVYTGSYPHFSNTNWGAGQDGANTMGAAFNYVLLVSEPGAYAHNSAYAKKLVLDSIDYLDNGQFDGSIASLALPGLVASGTISPAVAEGFTAYQGKSPCSSCHGGTGAAAKPMSSGAHAAHLNGAYGPGFYLGSELPSCQACHLYGSGTHADGSVNLVSGAGSACQKCHAGAAPLWGASARLACTSCHAATPARLPNGATAPYKALFAVAGHGRFASSSQCTVCHDPDSRHIAGSLGSYMRLRLSNDNALCASCHNSAAVGVAFRNMSTHVTPDGRALDCRVCHDPHGSANLSMIRQSIKGSSIVFSDEVNGLVDQVTNRGLCQVCHTLTSHYRAGVPESNHFTSGCLSCHPHNSAGGAFRPSGGNCDSCHGYPPVRKGAAGSFGTPGNWENARFEDYSGGGGGHQLPGHVAPGAKASEGWSNCAVCHNAGELNSTPYHKMTTPVQKHIDQVTVKLDQGLRFKNKFAGYSGAKLVNAPEVNQTGRCSNISCHMSPSPRWSVEH
jgi:trimeric autotransporter adhesin